MREVNDTDEHHAAVLLSRCRFTPGSFAKRFSRDLAALPSSQPLTSKQRTCLWQNVVKFRRQILVKPFVELAEVMLSERGPWEQALYDDPADWTGRLAYSDWLLEHDLSDLAEAQRWMGEKQKRPVWRGAGHRFGGEDGGGSCNFEWYWWEADISRPAHAWHHTRVAAEAEIAVVVAPRAGQGVKTNASSTI